MKIRVGELSRFLPRLGEICFGLVIVSLFFHWFNPVTTPAFTALNFPLWQPARLWPSLFTPFCYALPALVLCCLGYLGWRLRKNGIVLWAALLLLLLGLTFFLRIVCWEPTWLRAAIEGGLDFDRCYSFEVTHSIPDAVRGAPAGELTGTIDGLLTRFVAGNSALSSGWYLYMASSLLCLVAGFSMGTDSGKLGWVVLPGALLSAAVIAALLWRPIEGEFQIAAGANAAANGRFDGALAHYRHAVAVDKWNRLQPDVYLNIGALYAARSQKDQPEFHLYRAVRFEEKADMPQALFELNQASATAKPDLALIVQKEVDRVAQKYGKELYARGNLGDAKKQFELSAAVHPNQIAAYYLAGACCYEMSDYSAAIDYFNKALLRTNQRTLRADIRSSLGDCYFKLGNVELARSYYLASRLADDRKNYRALKSLTESYYR
jgi:Flp pilus assembly protein TadD